jgi:hypothetical protein
MLVELVGVGDAGVGAGVRGEMGAVVGVGIGLGVGVGVGAVVSFVVLACAGSAFGVARGETGGFFFFLPFALLDVE